MTQDVLAGLVGRTADWVGKVENNRIELDRLSVIRAVADALDVEVGDLLGEPSLLAWTPDSGHRTVPGLRDALLDYRQLSPLLSTAPTAPVSLNDLRRDVENVWDAYQHSRYGYVIARLPSLVTQAQNAVRAYGDPERRHAHDLLALAYQAAAVLLTKIGEADLAWIAAERGFRSAQQNGNPIIVGSLFRSVVHALLSTGRYHDAKVLTLDAASYLETSQPDASPEFLSVYGTLFLAGAMAAARDNDRATTTEFLTEAERLAAQLGHDANYLWTAFGPTNVVIHRVATALELGDVQVAIDLAPRVDAHALPVERRARHAIETARALTAWNRTDDALSTLLDAERMAPEHIQQHALSRSMVQTWIRRSRSKPSWQLVNLARRVGVAD